MGQHKYNPTAIAAKKGELPPKPQRLSKRQREALLAEMVRKATGIDRIERMIGNKY